MKMDYNAYSVRGDVIYNYDGMQTLEKLREGGKETHGKVVDVNK